MRGDLAPVPVFFSLDDGNDKHSYIVHAPAFLSRTLGSTPLGIGKSS